MKIRHGTWYETEEGHAAFIKKTKGEGRQPVQGFVLATGSGKPVNCTWETDGKFEWGYGVWALDIKGRWPHAKPKWCKIRQQYVFPKEVTMTKVIRHGAYYVTRNERLVFVQQTKRKCRIEDITYIFGWIWVNCAEPHWLPFSWYEGGTRTTVGTHGFDIIGRWKGELPARLPMEERESYYVE